MQPTQPLLTLSSSPQQGKVRGTTLCFRPQRFDGSVAARPRAQNLADSRWVVEIGRGAGEGKDEKDEKGGKGREREREGGREGGGCALQCHIVKRKNEKAPGCTGEGMVDWGYCITTTVRPPGDDSSPGFLSVDNSNTLHGGSRMGNCQGDCDYDSDCVGSLKCILREDSGHVYGCSGLPNPYWDYCGRQEEKVHPVLL